MLLCSTGNLHKLAQNKLHSNIVTVYTSALTANGLCDIFLEMTSQYGQTGNYPLD